MSTLKLNSSLHPNWLGITAKAWIKVECHDLRVAAMDPRHELKNPIQWPLLLSCSAERRSQEKVEGNSLQRLNAQCHKHSDEVSRCLSQIQMSFESVWTNVFSEGLDIRPNCKCRYINHEMGCYISNFLECLVFSLCQILCLWLQNWIRIALRVYGQGLVWVTK